MTRQEAKLGRFTVGTSAMSADEREAIKAAMRQAVTLRSKGESRRMTALITEIGAQRGRALQRRQSDVRTDKMRRKLVGARLPVEQAKRCKDCAASLGVSLYGFVLEALEDACKRVEAVPGWREGLPVGERREES